VELEELYPGQLAEWVVQEPEMGHYLVLELAESAQLAVVAERAIRLALPAGLAVVAVRQDQLAVALARLLVLYQALELAVELAQLAAYLNQPVAVAVLGCLCFDLDYLEEA
jgi:hypothetical protein